MAINVPLNAQLQNATQLQQQIQNAVNAVRINLGGPNGARALSSLSQPLGRLTGQADEFTKSLDAANARVLAFGASVGVVNAVTNAFKSLVNSTIEVEKAITAISVVGDQFAGKTKELSQGLFNIAKATGQSFSEVSKAALEFSRQGLSLEQTLARTQDALVLTRTTGLDAAKSVDGLTAAVNAFSKAGLSTTQILNKLAAVDQAFAVSSADLIEAFQRTGAVAQQAGVSFDELAGIVTALQTETSRGGAVIGNALKTIFSRLQDTSTLTQLQNLGVAVQDLQGNVLPARQILQNLAGDLQGLSKITQAGVFKDVAGTFQLNQLVSLVNDLNKAQSISAAATAKSAGATNEAYIANEKLNQSLDAILNKVATTGKQLGSLLGEIGLSDNLKGILDGLNSFLESANNVLQGDDLGSKFAKGFVKGIGAVLSGPGLGVFLAIIVKLSYDLLKFGAQSLKTFFNIGKAANDQKQIQESIVQTLLRNQNVLNSILSTQGGQNAQGLKFLGILNQQAAAMQAIQSLAGNIAGTVYSAGYRQTPQGLARRSAGGYLPAQEAADVRRGVGGASPSSKVVAIPNFAFGGGKRGTMIANTSEYIVPNYAGGGSAIFNQDMVKTMGLPAGAKKISAAGGFVPNFRLKNQTAIQEGKIFEKKLNKKFFGKESYSPNAALDFPLPIGFGTDQQARVELGISPLSQYGDAKRSFNRSNSVSLIDKYLRTSEGKLDFLKSRTDEKGFIKLNPKGLSMLFLYGQENLSNTIYAGTKNKSFSVATQNLIESKLSRTKNPNLSRTIKMPLIADKVNQDALNSSNGYIPNFANYVFDSDRLPSGSRDAILNAILSSPKRKNLLAAPAGAGKSTYASNLGAFISSLDDVKKASSFTILSGASLSSKGGLSSRLTDILAAVNASGGTSSYLGVSNKDILARRSSRDVTDTRSAQQLAGTAFAPLNQTSFIKQLKSSSSDFKMIRETKTNQDLAVLGLYGKNGAINGSPVYTLQSQRPELFKDIKKNLQKNVTNLVQAYAARIGKSVGIPVVPKNVEKSLNQLPSVAGFMFEDILNQLAGPDFDSNRISGGSRADFPLNENLRKVFGATGSQKYAEVKLNPYTADAVSSILSKQEALAGGAVGPQSIAGNKINEFKARAIALGIGQAGRVDTKTQSQRNALIKELIGAGIIKSDYGTSANQNKAIKRALGIASGGYVPNFADLDGDGTVTQRDGFYQRLKSAAKKYSKNPLVDFALNQVLQSMLGLPEGIEVTEIIKSCDKALKGIQPEIELNKILREKAANKKQQKRKDFLAKWRSPSGHIPNFAAAALQQAIAREKSAGLSDSQIYVDQSAALKSPMNPMGLMVANRRDEPAGGFQGIARARKEGMNPKLYGAAGGFVPNYAVQAPIGQIAAIKGVLAQDKVDAFNKALEDTAKQLKSNQISLSQAEQNIEIYAQTVGTSAKGQKILESEGKKLIQAYDTESKARKQKAEELRKQRSDKKNISEPSKDVNKGFADAAGKIFLLQSAVSFLTGAVGDSESSFAKLTQQVGSTIGNLTSLGLLGQQISQTNPAGNFGKFMKGLGLAGIGFAAVTEGFKLVDFAIKEFSGENQRAALASAKLADASDKLSLKFESLSKTRQADISARTEKILSDAGYRSIIGAVIGSSKAGGDIADNPEVRKNVSQLSALGAGSEEILKILASVNKFTEYGEEIPASLSEVLNALETSLSSGLGKKLSDQFRSFETALSGIDLTNIKDRGVKINEAIEKSYGKPRSELTKEQKILIDQIIGNQINLNKLKQEEQKAQNAINFGERLNLELAKQRLDSVFQLKQISEESLTPAERILQFQLETLDLSSREKILKESQLKNLDLERKKRIDILSATKSIVDEASKGELSIKTEDLDKLTKFLEDNLGKFNNQDFASEISKAFPSIAPKQAENLVASLGQQKKNIEASTDAQKKLNNEQTTFKLRIDNTNQSLQDQLSTFQRIAQTAQSVASLNISFGNLDIGKNEAEINRLQALASNPNLNISQKENIDKQVISLQKINNETKKRNELESFQAKQAELSSQILKERASLEKTTDQTKRQELNNNIDALIRQTKETENNYKASTLAIDANNLSLSVQEQQIGKVIGAYTSLNNQLLTFRRDAGERIGGAMFEQLGATDINSLMQARIKQNVETEAQAKNFTNDQDYYKFIQEQTRLRQIQFDLATAESATRKRELEYELKYTQEIIDLKNQGASDQELIDARNRQILEQRSGRRGFEKGLDTIQERIDNYRSTLGEEIPNLFSSNLAQGLNDAISGAKSLKEALSDAATSFFQEITRRNISNLADLVTGGLGKGVSSGGGIFSSILSFFGGGNKTGVTAAASGGMIKGGSGTKDDVPAMLMGGEYVVKKSAVNKYGKGFLDALNNGKMRGYATGGLVDPQTFPTQTGRGGFFTPGDYGQGAITGKNELLTFASQSFTGGQYDYMGGFGMGGATVSLEPESARLSALGREGSPMFERVQQSKDEAFKVYLEGLQKEKEYADLLDQIAKDKKARKKALQTAIISAVISSAASYAGTAMKVGAANASAAGGSKLAGAFVGSGGQGGLFNILRGTGRSLSTSAQALEYAKTAPLISNLSQQLTKQAFSSKKASPSNSNLSLPKAILANSNFINPLFPQARASGGLISGGSNIRDDVPAMLTGGEFVLNNRATQRIGLQNLNKLNSGAPISSEGSSPEMTQALISKLDELIQTTANSSKENVVVNVSTNETTNQTAENPAGAEKELQKKIREAVLNVIAQEKRLGGSLTKAK